MLDYPLTILEYFGEWVSRPLFLVVARIAGKAAFRVKGMCMNRAEIIRQTWALLEPHLVEQGYELVEVDFRPEGPWVLRLFIDKEGGVTLDDCVAVTQLIGPILDAEDHIPESYNLEVSSPGIDRPVRKHADFERFSGERVKLRTITALNGRRNFKGVLLGIRDGMIVLECDGTTVEVHPENLEKANLDR